MFSAIARMICLPIRHGRRRPLPGAPPRVLPAAKLAASARLTSTAAAVGLQSEANVCGQRKHRASIPRESSVRVCARVRLRACQPPNFFAPPFGEERARGREEPCRHSSFPG